MAGEIYHSNNPTTISNKNSKKNTNINQDRLFLFFQLCGDDTILFYRNDI